jgi:very-short-patch-repair endonuclease
MAHRSQEGVVRDAERNNLLRERGWYVLRVDSRSLGHEQHDRAVRQALTLVKRHRRAIVLARTNFHDLLG